MKNVNHNDTATPRSLRRDDDAGIIGGIAVGISKFFGVDVLYVRIGFAVLSVIGGGGLALYLAGWLLIPEEGADASIAQGLLRRTRTNAS
jgi:phage shock protein PspC (stress-responsive transcriptional regulator)